MTDRLIATLATFIAVFTLVKMAFGFLGWYSRIGKDHIYRRHLESLLDRLDSETISDIAHLALGRFVVRVSGILPSLSKQLLICIFVACVLPILDAIGYLWLGIPFEFGYMFSVGHYFVCSLLSLWSLHITLYLVTKAAVSKSAWILNLHVVADIIVFVLITLITGVWCVMYFLLLPTDGTDGLRIVIPLAIHLILNPPPLEEFYLYALIGIPAVPSVLYLCILCGLVCIKVINTVGIDLQRPIILVVSDDKPLFSQLGDFFGKIAGLVGAIIAFLRI